MSLEIEKAITQWANGLEEGAGSVRKVSTLKQMFREKGTFNDAQILSALLTTVQKHAALETKLTARGLENLRSVAHELNKGESDFIGKAVARVRRTIAEKIDVEVLSLEKDQLFHFVTQNKLDESERSQFASLVARTLPRLGSEKRKEFCSLFSVNTNLRNLLLSGNDTQAVKTLTRELFAEGLLLVAFGGDFEEPTPPSPEMQKAIREGIQEKLKIQPEKKGASIQLPKQESPIRQSHGKINAYLLAAAMEFVKGQFALTKDGEMRVKHHINVAILKAQKEPSTIQLSEKEGMTPLRETMGFERVASMKNILEHYIPQNCKPHAKLVELLKHPKDDKNFNALIDPLDKLVAESQLRPDLMENILKALPENLRDNVHFKTVAQELHNASSERRVLGNFVEPLKNARAALDLALTATQFDSDSVKKYRAWCKGIDEQKPDFRAPLS